MCYYVYILYSKSLGLYYKGQTKDLSDRINRHNSGYEKATKHGIPWELVWTAKKSSRTEALILEKKLKNLTKKRVQRFIDMHGGNVAGPDFTPEA